MEGDQNLRRTATLGALASVLIVAGIIVVVWLVFFRNHSSNSNSTARSNQSGQSSTQGQANGDGGSANQAQPNQSGSGQSGSGSTKTTPSTPAPSTTPSPTPAPNKSMTPGKGGQMPNSGPGDVVAVFVATSAAATGGYYLYLRRTQRAY